MQPIKYETELHITNINNYGEWIGWDENKKPKYQSSINVNVVNFGLKTYVFQLYYEIPELNLSKWGPLVKNRTNNYVEFYYYNYPQGTYNAVVKLYRFEGDNQILTDEKTVTIIIHDEGYSITYPKLNYDEITYVISQTPNKPIMNIQDCKDDVLVCLYFWPDMIRKLPNHDYSKKPAEQIVYEERIKELYNKDFNDFINEFS